MSETCKITITGRVQGVLQEIDFKEFEDFQIIPSQKGGRLNLPLIPDFGICEACKNEISDQGNRRYGYPFTTCANCGPRWAITNTFPFERNHTGIDNPCTGRFGRKIQYNV